MRLINCNFDGHKGNIFLALTHKGDTMEDETHEAKSN